MSGGPKKSHEETTNPFPAKRSIEEGGVLQHNPGKASQYLISHSFLSRDPGLDGKPAKVSRTEHRDSDKRSSPLPHYRVSSSANGAFSDHTVSSEAKETNIGDLNAEARVGSSASKMEGDSRQEIKGEIKFFRTEREILSDFKNESRLEKEGAIWRESKEYHRIKRHSEALNDDLEEIRKEVSISGVRDTLEAHEPVDLKGADERVRDRERKRKDERDKDRSERRSSLKHTGNSGKDLAREDRDTERWERERKESHKDKEKKDRREMISVNERESPRNEKEAVETPVKTPDQEGTSSDSKRTNDYDVMRGADRDAREKKRERDHDPEVDRNEKRRHHEKESDDGSMDGVNEREREVFSYSVQQRRRMLRPRATYSSSREPRFRARARENDGSQVKSESSAITYRVGECMQELMKSWKEYEASNVCKTVEGSQSGPSLEIRIPAEHITTTNRQVRGGQLWGTDVYTDDSDLVAVLMHTGYCRPTASLPLPAIQELRATIRVLPPQTCYHSTLRNNVRSRAWGAGIGCSYRVEKCTILKKGGGTLDLEPCLALISAVEPTLAPVSIERTMTTRSAASNALRQQRFVREVTVQYNLCNEPWVKYSINFVADKGLKKALYTSARLKKGEVIYVETHFKRYELCYTGEKPSSHSTDSDQEKPSTAPNGGPVSAVAGVDKTPTDLFRWSLCKKPLPQELMRSLGIPLPLDHLQVLEENLEWESVQWSQTGVWVAGKEYPLARVHFLSPN